MNRSPTSHDVLSADLAAEMKAVQQLHDISTRLLTKSSLGDLLDEILDSSIEVLGADFGNIQLRDGDVLRILAQRGFPEEFLSFFREVSHSSAAVCSAALRTGQRVIVEDVRTDPLFVGTEAQGVLLRAGIAAVQSTPLLSTTGELYGVISTHFRKPRVPSERSLRYLDLLASRAAQLIERVQFEQAERRAAQLQSSAEIANHLAHEINNPVQALTNLMELLSRDQAVGSHSAELVRVGQQQVARITATVKQLLEVHFQRGEDTPPEITMLLEQARERFGG